MKTFILIFLLSITTCSADSLIVGGWSYHHHPDDSVQYNSSHNVLGYEKSLGKNSISLVVFKNSYYNNSFALFYTIPLAEYTFKDLSISLNASAGAATGYKNTVANIAVLPFVKMGLSLNFKGFSIVPSIMPNIYKDDSDKWRVGAIFMVGFKIDL